MIRFFNRFLGTWAARAFFLLLLVALVGWGISGSLSSIGSGTALATVAGRDIDRAEFDGAYRRQLAQMAHMMGNAEPTPEVKRGVAVQVLDRMVVQAAIAGEVRRMGLAVPDDDLRQAIFDLPAFKGTDGRFDRTRFNAILQNNGLTEPAFLALMREDLGQQQLIEAVRAGAVAPDVLTDAVFRFTGEKRVAQTVFLPFAGAAEPPAPDDAALHRAYDNNPDSYTSPEYRRIKAVVLSADTLARSLAPDVTTDEMRAAYFAHKDQFNTPETRSLQVIVAADEAAARSLAQRWQGGADWDAMQQAAKDAGASAVALDDATAAQVPSPDLAQAAFAAAPDAVTGPVRSALGWQVLRVTKVTPAASKSFEQAQDALRAQVAQTKAADAIYDRANKLQDALASGSTLDQLPGDLGVAAITGTLDAQGLTPDDEPAPIPGPPALRTALIAAAFAAHKGDQPSLQEVAGQAGAETAYYAVVVEDITPPALKPYDQVAAQVRDDWLRDARRHEQEEVAAKLLTAVKSGQPLADAANLAGLAAKPTPPVARQGTTPGVPAELGQVLFTVKKGESTMTETPEGFVVAELTDIQVPSRDADPIGYGRTRDQLAGAVGNDLELSYAAALRERGHPTVNRAMLDSVTQPGS